MPRVCVCVCCTYCYLRTIYTCLIYVYLHGVNVASIVCIIVSDEDNSIRSSMLLQLDLQLPAIPCYSQWCKRQFFHILQRNGRARASINNSIGEFDLPHLFRFYMSSSYHRKRATTSNSIILSLELRNRISRVLNRLLWGPFAPSFAGRRWGNPCSSTAHPDEGCPSTFARERAGKKENTPTHTHTYSRRARLGESS